jgi:NAD(P)-dependent dehydrogenase (short-subunit alcohol dehydrogenase family)
MRLAGKVCLITGAGSGIGRPSAVVFAAEGASVTITDIDTSGADGTKASIDAAGGASLRYDGFSRRRRTARAGPR